MFESPISNNTENRNFDPPPCAHTFYPTQYTLYMYK